MNLHFRQYDVIVVGAGHAGCEAAAAAANLGSKTLLVTMDMNKFAQMSCNPAIGGIAKGQIVREIDAIGGYTGIITDRTSIQFRMLNLSKGPAMWSPRSQCDRVRFSEEWRKELEKIELVHFWQDSVVSLIVHNNKVCGVKTKFGVEFFASAVILTNGTFLNGRIFIGQAQADGGRIGEEASYFLSDQLAGLGFNVGRLKTGTPVRLDGRTIDFSKLTEQKGDSGFKFSFLPKETNTLLKQRSCWVTSTNKEVHSILEGGFEESPMYDGTIKGVGPRYCPSIESKIVTFSDKDSHHLYVEPEGEDTVEFYLNGFSSSLPWEIQYDALHKIEGLENVKIFRPGYAIEYDYFEPTQLYATLETKLIENLFFAGQINGTTGYEEAAAQGLIAGINAHLKITGKESFVLNRDEAYIGVLIDDLVTKGVDEPYRMFTSRAEYRILLRQDNADQRLTVKSYDIGLASQERVDLLEYKNFNRDRIIDFVSNYSVKAGLVDNLLISKGTTPLKQGLKLKELILRPQLKLVDFLFIRHFKKLISDIDELLLSEILQSAENFLKYEGYIEREKALVEKFKRMEDLIIEGKFDYSKIDSISVEGRQKLMKIQPKTIGQASRIIGVSPADINVLLILLGR